MTDGAHLRKPCTRQVLLEDLERGRENAAIEMTSAVTATMSDELPKALDCESSLISNVDIGDVKYVN